MHEPRSEQVEFGFGGGDSNHGYGAWVREREEEIREMARRVGLPLGRLVEVWLKDGTLLKGRLVWRGDERDWELVIGAVGFRTAEIESCVRVD